MALASTFTVGVPILLLVPSCTTAELRITPQILSPSDTALDNLFRIRTPTPSALPNPSAPASNVLHLPFGASKPSNSPGVNGWRSKLTPTAIATSQASFRKLSQAISTPAIEVEHPLSVEKLGPINSKKWEILAVSGPSAFPM